MVSPAIANIVNECVERLSEGGFHVTRAILYGSQARGDAREHSDIDLLILSPQFENMSWQEEGEIWNIVKQVDSRIEPLVYGEKTYDEDDWHPLIDTIKREGIEIPIDKSARQAS